MIARYVSAIQQKILDLLKEEDMNLLYLAGNLPFDNELLIFNDDLEFGFKDVLVSEESLIKYWNNTSDQIYNFVKEFVNKSRRIVSNRSRKIIFDYYRKKFEDEYNQYKIIKNALINE